MKYKLNGIISAIAFAILAIQSSWGTELRVFEWEGYISLYKDDFEKYAKSKGKDIKLTFVKNKKGDPFITSADDIFEASRGGECDVVTPTHNYYKGSDSRLLKTLAPIDFGKLTHYNDLHESLRKLDYAKDGDGNKSVPLLGGSYALIYNSEKVSAPDSWSALGAADAAGKTSITNDQYEANIYQLAIMSGVPPAKVYEFDNISEEQSKKIQDMLASWLKNTKSFWGAMPSTDEMKSELHYATDYWFGTAAANKAGGKWKFAQPKEGVTVWLDTTAITQACANDPAKLEAAYMLIDYSISPEVQARIHQEFGSVIVNAKAKDLLPEELKAGLPGAEFFIAERFWQPLTDRTRNKYKALWDAAMKQAGK